MKTEKYCPKCDRTRPISCFSLRSKRSKYYQSYCSECRLKALETVPDNPEAAKKRRAKYREANKKELNRKERDRYDRNREQEREQYRQWSQTPEGKEINKVRRERHRSRKVNAPGDCTYEQWLEILDAHGFTCYLCHRPHPDLQMEHKRPLSRGGSNDPRNIAPSCPTCNQRKGSMTYSEYAIALMKGER